MQNAKDTFYITLRSRLTTVNPNRTVSLRAVSRPGILVEEAEAPMAQLPLDVFVLSWTKLAADTQLPAILAQMTCEIHYATAGTQVNAGLDRGRALEEMDYEVLQLLHRIRRKDEFRANTGGADGHVDFLVRATFAPATTVRERMGRVATVKVFAFQEQGEQ